MMDIDDDDVPKDGLMDEIDDWLWMMMADDDANFDTRFHFGFHFGFQNPSRTSLLLSLLSMLLLLFRPSFVTMVPRVTKYVPYRRPR